MDAPKIERRAGCADEEKAWRVDGGSASAFALFFLLTGLDSELGSGGVC